MSLDKFAILELREVFRARMKVDDFCIGEDKVERLFRELLGEPEPTDRPLVRDLTSHKEFLLEMEKLIPKIRTLFERDIKFFDKIK